jgi:hypothetical protein
VLVNICLLALEPALLARLVDSAWEAASDCLNGSPILPGTAGSLKALLSEPSVSTIQAPLIHPETALVGELRMVLFIQETLTMI